MHGAGPGAGHHGDQVRRSGAIHYRTASLGLQRRRRIATAIAISAVLFRDHWVEVQSGGEVR